MCISSASKHSGRNNTAKASGSWEQHTKLNRKDVQQYTL